MDEPSLDDLAAALRASRGLAAKADIGHVAARLGLPIAAGTRIGDDCAVIPDRDGHLLFAIEGFMNEFVAADPWFSGWCGVMVNLSDVAAMGGRPIAVVDAIWAAGDAGAEPVLDGLAAAAQAYGVPIVGGHSNLGTDRGQLSVAILGRAGPLLSSFEAQPGERLVAAIDLRGRYREPFSNWDAATAAPPSRLRGDLELLPRIAEAGLSRACKDVSQGGVVGTAAMLAEASGVAITIDVDSVPRPEGVALARWLQSFPSFGYLLSVATESVEAVTRLFAARGIAAATIGEIEAGSTVTIRRGGERRTIWNFTERPLIGCAPLEAAA